MTNLMILMTGIKDEQHLPKCTSKTLIYKRPRRPNKKIKKKRQNLRNLGCQITVFCSEEN